MIAKQQRSTTAERGLEFTQLDVEMSFIDEEDIIGVIEPLYARIVAETHGAASEGRKTSD